MPQSVLTLYFTCHGNEAASSLNTDVDRYAITGNVLHIIFNILPEFLRRWETQTHFLNFSSVKLPKHSRTLTRIGDRFPLSWNSKAIPVKGRGGP
jgi:hypothetical protein